MTPATPRVVPEPEPEAMIGRLPIEHADTKNLLKLMVFAPGGAGKTRLLGSAQLDERTAPMLLLDYEGGVHVLKGIRPKVDVVTIRDWNDCWEVYDYLVSDANQYRTVGLDSLSEAHFGAITEILDDTALARKDPDRIDQSDYGKAATQIKRMMRAYYRLPMHVLFSAGHKEDEEPRHGKVTKVALSGQLANDIHRILDVVGYLASTTDASGAAIRSLLVANVPGFRVKARLPFDHEPVESIDEPTITKILDILGY